MRVVYEHTKDGRLLKQYYQLRESCYRRELNLSGFDGREQSADRDGHILIARQGERCLGGARISARVGDKSIGVPLKAVLPRFGLAPGNICIWERFALSREMRQSAYHQQFCEALANLSRSLGYDYAFMVSSKRNARFYRKVHSALNMPFVTLDTVPCLPMGPFEGLEHVLSVSMLQSVLSGKDSALYYHDYSDVAA